MNFFTRDKIRKKYIMKIFCHVTSRNRMVKEIRDFAARYVTSNHKPPFCQVWRPQVTWKRIYSVFNFLFTSWDHVIKRLFDFMDNRPALKPTPLSSLVAIGLTEVETFFISHVITWSDAQNVKRLDWWWPFTINVYLAKFGGHRPWGSGDISFFIYHVTSSDHIIARSRNFAGCGPSA